MNYYIYLGSVRDIIMYKHNVHCMESSGMALVNRHVYWIAKLNPPTAFIFCLDLSYWSRQMVLPYQGGNTHGEDETI